VDLNALITFTIRFRQQSQILAHQSSFHRGEPGGDGPEVEDYLAVQSPFHRGKPSGDEALGGGLLLRFATGRSLHKLTRIFPNFLGGRIFGARYV
jgi:hypothetical protein